MSIEMITSGFSTSVKIDGSKVMCTSLSVNDSNSVLESNGAFGAEIEVGNDAYLLSNYLLDYGDVNISIGYDPNLNQLSNIVNWWKNRNKSHNLSINTGNDNIVLIDECYLTSSSIQCNAGSLVSADCSFWCMSNSFDNDGNYSFGGSLPYTSSYTKEIDFVSDVVPYWNTKVTGLPYSEVVNWRVSFNQEIVKKFYCSGESSNDDPKPPKAVMFARPNITLDVDIIASKDSIDMNAFSGRFFDNVSIFAGGNSILSFGKVLLLTGNPVVADAGNYQYVSFNFKVVQF